MRAGLSAHRFCTHRCPLRTTITRQVSWKCQEPSHRNCFREPMLGIAGMRTDDVLAELRLDARLSHAGARRQGRITAIAVPPAAKVARA